MQTDLSSILQIVEYRDDVLAYSLLDSLTPNKARWELLRVRIHNRALCTLKGVILEHHLPRCTALLLRLRLVTNWRVKRHIPRMRLWKVEWIFNNVLWGAVHSGRPLKRFVNWLRSLRQNSIEERADLLWLGLDAHFYQNRDLPQEDPINNDKFECDMCYEELPAYDRGVIRACTCESSSCKECLVDGIKANGNGQCPSICKGPIFHLDLQSLKFPFQKMKSVIVKSVLRQLDRRNWIRCQDEDCDGIALLGIGSNESQCICCDTHIEPEGVDVEMARKLVNGLAQLTDATVRECFFCGTPTQKAGGCNSIHCKECDEDWNYRAGVPGRHDFRNSMQYYVPMQGMLQRIGFYKGFEPRKTQIPVAYLIRLKQGKSVDLWLDECLHKAQLELDENEEKGT